MATEAGDKKLLGNFRILIDYVSTEPNYNPANPKVTKAALETQYTNGAGVVGDVAAAHAPNKLAITDRQSGFDDLRPLVIRSNNYLKASGASKEVVADAQTSVRKLTGSRKSPKIKDNPATPVDESKGSHSASQMSYDNQLGNVASYLAILQNIAEYNPNEADLKVTALQAVANALQAKNNAVSTTAVALAQARGNRDQLLYLADDSIVNTAQLVKNYIKAALGTYSQLYNQVKGLRFTR